MNLLSLDNEPPFTFLGSSLIGMSFLSWKPCVFGYYEWGAKWIAYLDNEADEDGYVLVAECGLTERHEGRCSATTNIKLKIKSIDWWAK